MKKIGNGLNIKQHHGINMNFLCVVKVAYNSMSLFKWALESITTSKASGGDGLPVELFQILKDDAVKSAALNMPANLENSAVATGLEKVSFHSNPKERQCQRMLKTPHNCTHLTC